MAIGGTGLAALDPVPFELLLLSEKITAYVGAPDFAEASSGEPTILVAILDG